MRAEPLFVVSSIATLAFAAACGSGSSTPASDRTGPTTAPTTAPPSTAAPTLMSTHVYFLRGEKVVSVHRDVLVTAGAVATAAMRALVAGPTASERAAGVATTIPVATRVRGVTITNNIADVDLTTAYESGGGSLSMSARLMQVVYTLTQFPAVHGVTFRIDGKAITVFGGEGIVLGRPATRAQYASFLPAIFIDSPAMGETVSSPLVVRGLADVFEGQFLVEVTNAAGKVLARVPAHASMGQHTAFTVTLRFTVTTPGAGRVTGFDYSARDGSRILDYVVPVMLR